MAILSYTSRRELEQHQFHPAVTLLVPLAAVILQVLLPRAFAPLSILDLPLIVTIFFAVARRSPIAGTFTGTFIGLLQDLLTNQPLGVFGMAKAVIGYTAASIGTRIDVENILTRILMNFGFSLLQSLLLFAINRELLGVHGAHVLWPHELARAGINTAVSIPIFLLLDQTKRDS